MRLGFRSLLSLSGTRPEHPALEHMVRAHIPLPDFTLIDPVHLHRAVAFLMNAPRPVAVHCMGGIGRTGTTLACLLVALGRSAQAAIDELRRLRPGSIDHEDLERSVFGFEAYLQHVALPSTL